MPAQPLELILARQFGDSLSMPFFLVDPEGNLLFYNEAAEGILGLRFTDTGGMRVEEWATMFRPADLDGNPMPPEDLPLVRTLNTRQPAHGSFSIDNVKGERVVITVTSFPLEGRPNRYLGAIAMFWKSES
ncbi:PAS domain-containing protein [Algoriphagus aestuariicola]|jgi:PAS domain-containing protein|uniref:PAS domain-containing protein n=1 Tax=Algoriphagus aestuariicola TaxID=1852016 RepID=A0ABS3BWF2_9BACT|nr:PAS domain-containing protein [Algoriphagus aestuariicola]MBN7803635.1 PAS domain-containing protein [Algoriphagus aestuariicola]